MLTDGLRPTGRLVRDMESRGHCSPCRDCDACSKSVPAWQHIRRTPKEAGAAFDVLSTPAFLGAGARGQTLTVAVVAVQTAAGPGGDVGWGVAAETEVEAEACSQVLTVTMAGLMAEAQALLEVHSFLPCVFPACFILCLLHFTCVPPPSNSCHLSSLSLFITHFSPYLTP